MTPEQRLDEMETDIKGIIAKQEESGKKLDSILVALQGDEMGNPGFTHRISTLESDMRTLKEVRTINSVYIRIITFLISIIAVALITGIVGYFIRPK